jgi:hypothetical protein
MYPLSYSILAIEDPTPEALSLLRKAGVLTGSGKDVKDWTHDRFRRLTSIHSDSEDGGYNDRRIALREDLAKISKIDGITEEDMKQYWKKWFNSQQQQQSRSLQHFIHTML